MAPRSKPRINHVRTGCITCKRRRVKCPEEHPHCSRCIQGGFICAGYAVPQPWIFRSGIEAEKGSQVDLIRPRTCRDRQFMDSNNLVKQSRSSIQVPSPASVHSPLQLGNSDPFNVYAIPIGPRESHLLTTYHELVAPRLYPTDARSWDDMDMLYSDCLKDEAAACALLARNSAMEELILRGRYATPSAPVFGCMARSCAALRRKLSLMDGSETVSVVTPVMWASCFLAATEIFTRFATVEVHLRGMSQLVVQYIDLMDGKPDTLPILIMTFLDTMRACATLSRPMIDTYRWFPRLFQNVWDSTDDPYLNAQAGGSETGPVHADVQDKILRDVMVSRREARPFPQDEDSDPDELKTKRNFLLSRLIYQYSQLLHVALDALERLKSPRVDSKEEQCQIVRAYLSVSSLLWVQVTISMSSFTTDILFDFTSNMLRHLRIIIQKDLLVRDTVQCHKQAYSDARLWALYIAVQTRLRKRAILDSDLACEEWFLQTFRAEAKSMQIQSWQQSVQIFEQFLYDDRVEPQISLWWQQMISGHSIVTMEQTEHEHMSSPLECK